MRAMHSIVPGGPDSLVLAEGLPVPSPGADEVLVRVHAAGLNFPDLLRIEDRYQERVPRPFAPGSEVAGVVTAVGSAVSEIRPGQRVMAITGWGGLAEQVAVAATKVSAIPDAMPFDDASAFLVTYGTAYHALRDRAALQPGETLVVLGASGGVGLAAVELGKAMGARVVAAASTAEKLEIARQAGADATVCYCGADGATLAPRELTAALKQACGPDGAAVVFDPVGGDLAEPTFRAIGWGGRYLVIGFATGISSLPLNLPLLKGASVIGVFWGESVTRNPAAHRQDVDDLLGLYIAGSIRPRIHGRWPLENAAEALTLLGSRRATGKLVVLL